MRGVEAEATSFGARFGAAANGLSSFMIRMGLVGGVLAAFAVHSATAFQSSQRNIAVYAGAGTANAAAMGNAALELSRKYGESATAIEKSMYAVYSSGQRQKIAMQEEANGTEIAAASHAKLDDVMKALNVTMLDYPRSFKNVHDAAGQMNEVVKQGGMTWQEYSRSISTVEPLASALGLSFASVGAMVVQLTRHGNSAAEATQMLKNSIMQTIMPSTQMRNASEALGLSWQNVYARHGGNAVNILNRLVIASQRHTLTEHQVAEAVGQHGVRAAKLYELLQGQDARLRVLTGSSLAYSSVMQTLGARDLPKTEAAMRAIENGANSLDAAWRGVSDTTEAQAKRLHASFQSLGIVIGTVLLPAVNSLIGVLLPLGEHLAILVQHHQEATKIIGLAALGFLAFGVALKGLLVITDIYRQSFVLLKGALEITGILSKTTAETQALGAAQGRNTLETNLAATAQMRLRTQDELAAASKAMNLERVNQLTAGLSNLDVVEKTLIETNARQKVAQGDVALAMKETVIAEEELQNAQTRMNELNRALSVSTQELAAEQSLLVFRSNEQKTAWAEMSLANNQLSSSNARFNAEMRSLGVTQQADIDLMRMQTALGQESILAKNNQAAAVQRLKIANSELQAQSAAVGQAATVQAADEARLSVALNDVAAAEGRVEGTGAVLLTERQALAGATAEAALAADGLAASEDALTVSETVLEGITGALTATFAALFSPVTIVILAIVGLIYVFKELYQHCQAFHQAVDGLVHLLGDVLGGILSTVGSVFTEIGDAFSAVGIKIDGLTGSTNGFIDIFAMIFPPLGVAIELIKHLGDALNLCKRAWDSFTSAAGKAGNWLDAHVPGFKAAKDAVQGLGDKLAHTGSQMDAAGHKVDDQNVKVQHLSKSWQDLAVKVGLSADSSKADIVKAAAAFDAANARTQASIKEMLSSVDQAFAEFDKKDVTYATDVAAHWIKAMLAARVSMIDQIKAVRNEAAVPIKFAPIQKPDLSGINTHIKPDAAKDTAGVAADMGTLGRQMSDLKESMSKLPPEFASVGASITKEFGDKIRTAHNDFLTKMATENSRHAAALNAINKTERDQLKSEYERAQQARASEDSTYLAKLKQIQDDHAQKVAQYLAMQSNSFQVSSANFSASMAQFNNRLSMLNDAHRNALTNLHNLFIQKLGAVHGKYQEEQRKNLEAWDKREKGNIEQRYNRDKANIEWHVNHLAEAFKNHNDGQIAAMKTWLAGTTTSFNRHIAGVNAAHTRHVQSIDATHGRHVTNIHAAHNDHVTKENTVHQRHVDGLTTAFHNHILKIEAAMKTVQGPAGMWDKLTKSANDLADGAMKKLAMQFLLHGTATAAQIASVIKDQKAGNDLAAAMKKAESAVTEMGGHALKVKQTFEQLSTQIGNHYKKAMDDATRDLMTSGHVSAAHAAALQRAVTQQNRLTAAQAAAQKMAEADGAKHKKVADDWAASMSNLKSKLDGDLSQAIGEYVMQHQRGSIAMAMYQGEIIRAAKAQEAFKAREQRATDIATAALDKLPISVVHASTAFENVKKTVDDQLKISLAAGAEEIRKHGAVTAATTAAIQRYAVQQQQNAEAERRASDIATAALLGLPVAAVQTATAFDSLKTTLDSRLKTAMTDAADEFMRTGQISAATVASLQQMQGAIDAVTKAENAAAEVVGDASTRLGNRLKDLASQLANDEAVITQKLHDHIAVTQSDIDAVRADQEATKSWTEAQWEASFATADLATKSKMLADKFQQLVSQDSSQAQATAKLDSADAAVLTAQNAIAVHDIQAMTTAINDATAVMSAQQNVVKAGYSGQLSAINDQTSILKDLHDVTKATSPAELAVAKDQLALDRIVAAQHQSQAQWAAKIAQDQLREAIDKQNIDAANDAATRTILMDQLSIAEDSRQLALAEAKLAADMLVVLNDINMNLGAEQDYSDMVRADLASIDSIRAQMASDAQQLAADQAAANEAAAQGEQQLALDKQQTQQDTGSADAANQAYEIQIALQNQQLQKDQLVATDAAAAAAKKSSSSVEAQLRAANATLTAQLETAIQDLALANKMLYISRLGLSRVLVGTGTQGFLNNLAGSAAANVSA